MSDKEIAIGKSKIPRITKDYDLVGGLTLKFKEPAMEDFDEPDNIVVLAKMLVSIGNTSLVDKSDKDKIDLIKTKNSALTAAMINRMNAFLKSNAKIEKEELTDEGIIKDLFQKDTVERTLTISHEGRKMIVRIGIPKTKESNMSTGEVQMGTYVTELNDMKKKDYEKEEWDSIVEDIPYLLSRDIPKEYWKLFDKSTALMLDDKKLLSQIENF